MSQTDVTAASPEEVEDDAAYAAAASSPSSGHGSSLPGKAKAFWPNFLRMLGLMSPFKLHMGIATVAAIASVVLTVWAPKVLGKATNLVFEGAISAQLPQGLSKEQMVAGLRAKGEDTFADMLSAMHVTPGQGIDFTQLRNVLLLAVAIYVAGALLNWLQGWLINIVMVRALYNLRTEVERKIHRLPLSYFDGVARGDMLSRITNDIDNIANTMQQSLSSALTSILTIIGVIGMMLTISWKMTLVALAIVPAMGLLFGVIGPRAQKAFTKQWVTTGALNARVEESFSGHALVRTYGQTQASREAFAKENEALYRTAFTAQFLSGIMMPIMRVIANLSYVGIAVVGALFVANGQLRLGDVQACIQYSNQFAQPLGQLGSMATSVQSGVASAERIFQILDADEETPDAASPAQPNPEGAGVIDMSHVRFSYTPERPLIRDLSLHVEPGQTVAIVGPTGAGKTTLVNLLMRFYELDGGTIDLDGVNTAQMTRHAVRSRTGMVLQDPWLFQGTIRENIRYGRPGASDEDVEAAARACYVDHIIRALPEGYDTVLEEDAANISVGERQLLTIARAFIADPAVLILDEATSSVDTRTEVLVQEAMAKLREGRTSFVIAHRLSTIRDADVILVMEHGDIVEQGSHEELMAAQGPYARLQAAQFAGDDI